MRRHFGILVCFSTFAIFGTLWPFAAQGSPLSLSECYQAALAASESLGRQGEEVVAAEARYNQVFSAVYPQVTASAQQRIRNTSAFGQVSRGGGVTQDSSGDPSTGGRSGGIGKTQAEASFSVSQPIFNGFRDLYAAQSAARTQQALALELQRSREVLYQNVADLYYQIQMYGSDLRVLDQTGAVLRQRIDELHEFVKLGKARESEVLAAESDLEDAAAVQASVRGVRAGSLELLAFLIARPAAEIELLPTSESPPLEPLESYLTRAQSRSDLEAIRLQGEAAEYAHTVSERGGWPVVRLEGTGYPAEDPDRNRGWDVSLRLDVPLFTGGRIEAEVAESAARVRQQSLLLQERRRTIERDIRKEHAEILSARAEKKQIERLSEIARKNLVVQKQDYSLGVVTNLEVLSAIRRQQDAERRHLAIEATIARSMAALLVAAGAPPP